MNIELKIFGRTADTNEVQTSGQGQPVIHPALFRQNNWVVQNTVVWLRTYGISRVELQLAQGLGLVPVSNISIELMDNIDDKIPEALVQVRPKIVRNIILPTMELYGYNIIGIKMTDAELTELHGQWAHLGAGEQPLADDLKFANIPMTYEKDPTAAEVVAVPPPATNIVGQEPGNVAEPVIIMPTFEPVEPEGPATTTGVDSDGSSEEHKETE